MTGENLKAFVKSNLRIVTDAFDENEIDHLITAGQEDITQSCGVEFDTSNTLMCYALVLFVRSRFGDGDDKAWMRYKECISVLGTRLI